MNRLFLLLCLVVLLPIAASAAGGAPDAQETSARPQTASAPPQNAAPTSGTAVPVPEGTTGAAGPTAVPNLDPNEYKLGSGDKIRVEVYKEPQLSQSLQVRPDGKITMPLIGDIVAAGLTPVQLRDQIGTSLKDYLNNPVVTVMVVEALASTVDVMGEVNKPGTIALTGPMTVVQAIARAGGFGPWAKKSHIRILRQSPNGVETIEFNYDKAIEGDRKGNIKMLYLQRGDTIIVP